MFCKGRGTRASFAIVIAVGLLLAAGPAMSRDSRTVSPEVKAVADQAERDARDRKYEKSIEGFQRAWEMSREPAYLFNIAVLCFMRLKDMPRAWETAMRFREAVESDEERKEVDRFLAKVEAELVKDRGKVVISVRPSTASLWIDARNAGGRLRRPVAWLPAGEHKVLAEADSCAPGEVTFNVTAGGTHEVTVALEASEATLRVECPAPRCRVSIDGIQFGEVPVERKVRPGRHLVAGDAEGFQSFEEAQDLGPGEEKSITLHLVALPPPPAAKVVSTPVPKPVWTNPYKTWAWVSTGTAAAALAAGTVLIVLAGRDLDAAERLSCDAYATDEACGRAFDRKVGSGRAKGYAAYALWGAGAAAAGAAVYLHIRAARTTAVIVPAILGGPGACAVMRW